MAAVAAGENTLPKARRAVRRSIRLSLVGSVIRRRRCGRAPRLGCWSSQTARYIHLNLLKRLEDDLLQGNAFLRHRPAYRALESVLLSTALQLFTRKQEMSCRLVDHHGNLPANARV